MERLGFKNGRPSVQQFKKLRFEYEDGLKDGTIVPTSEDTVQLLFLIHTLFDDLAAMTNGEIVTEAEALDILARELDPEKVEKWLPETPKALRELLRRNGVQPIIPVKGRRARKLYRINDVFYAITGILKNGKRIERGRARVK